jgi:hypothetical protein
MCEAYRRDTDARQESNHALEWPIAGGPSQGSPAPLYREVGLLALSSLLACHVWIPQSRRSQIVPTPSACTSARAAKPRGDFGRLEPPGERNARPWATPPVGQLPGARAGLLVKRLYRYAALSRNLRTWTLLKRGRNASDVFSPFGGYHHADYTHSVGKDPTSSSRSQNVRDCEFSLDLRLLFA